MAFGTLRRDSFFTPGQVWNEANSLNEAVRALAQIQFDHSELVDEDWLAGWNAFVHVWRDFWGQAQSWTSWFFLAKDSTRDELLDLEDQYQSFKARLTAVVGSDAAQSLPDANPASSRTADNVSSALDDVGTGIKSFGGQLIAGAAIVVLGGVALLAVARRGGLGLA